MSAYHDQPPGAFEAGSALYHDPLASLAAVPLPIMAHDLDGEATIRFVNPAFVETFGCNLDDEPTVPAWAARTWPDPAQRARALAQWRRDVATVTETHGEAPTRDDTVRDRMGRARSVRFTVARHEDLAIVTIQDRPEAQDAKTALDAERLTAAQTAYALTENMPAGAYTMVLRPGESLAHFAFLSQQFLDMLELTREEAVGDPSTGFSRVHPDDRARWLELNVEAFTRKTRFSAETRVIAHGRTRWVRAESVPRDLEDGTTIWEGVLVDVTDLKEAERRLKTVIEAARAYTWRRDLLTRRSEFDSNLGALTGEQPQLRNVPSETWFQTVHPADADAVKTAVEALEAGLVDNRILTYRRTGRDGAWIWLQVHAGISERDAAGRPTALSGVSFDITAEVAERQRAQEELAQLREELQRAQLRDTIAEVAGSVVHDLNNLMVVIAGTVEILEMEAVGQGFAQDGLGRIRRSLDKARELTGRLGRLVQKNRPRALHDLRTLMKAGVELLGTQRVDRHAVRLHLPDHAVTIWGNQTDVVQVIVNLAINACDSGSDDRAATVELSVLPAGAAPPSTPPDAGDLPEVDRPLRLFSISDTGTGVSDAVREHMFRSSFTTKGEAGSGLGLPIVSRILQENRAGLWIDSAPGAGTSVTVAWPAAAPSVAEPGATGAGEDEVRRGDAVEMGLLNNLCVLVVDDLAEVADVFADMLEAAGATVVTTSDPMEAQRFLTETPDFWSVLVTDLHMPDVDGVGLARFAKELSPPIPAVLVTARAETLSTENSAVFAAVLPKPVSMERLARSVREAARRHD